MTRVVLLLMASWVPLAGWADELPPGAVLRVGSPRWRASAPVQLTVFREGGRELVAYSGDGFVTVWDAEGKEVRRFHVTGGAANAVRVTASSDGRTLAVIGPMRTLTIWDVPTGKARHHLGAFLGSLLALSPDGRRLAGIETTGRVLLWNLADEQPESITLGPAPDGARRLSHRLEFSRDGKTILAVVRPAVANTRPEAIVWDVETHQELRRVEIQPEGAAPDSVLSAIPSPDLASIVLPKGASLQTIDLAAGKNTTEFPDIDQLNSSAFRFTPEGNELVQVMGRGEAVVVWDAAKGRIARRFGQPDDETANRPMPVALAIAPDGGRVAVADGAIVRLIDLKTGQTRGGESEGHTTALFGAYYSPDGQSILTRSDRLFIRWDARDGTFRERHELPTGHSSFLITRDMKWLVATSPDLTLTVYDLATKQEQHRFSTEAQGGYTYTIGPDSRTLIVLSRPATHLKIFDLTKGVRTGELVLPPANPAQEAAAGTAARRLTMSRDGRRVAACTEGFVVIWDLAWSREVRRLPIPPGRMIRHITFSPDGRLLAIEFYGGEVALWEIAGGVKRRTLTEGTPAADPGDPAKRLQLDGVRLPASLALSPDGRLAAGADAERTIHIWDARSGRELGTFAGHRAAVTGVSFSPDSTRLVSACADATALVWDLAELRAKLTASPARQDADQLWTSLSGTDGAAAFDAILALAAEPDLALPLLRDRLKPVAAPEEATIARLIADLDADRFPVRVKARRELEKLGEFAVPALRDALESSPSIEVRTQARRILNGLGERPLTAEEAAQSRAVEVLELIATPAAREFLALLAKGAAAAPLTAEAAAALERLSEK